MPALLFGFIHLGGSLKNSLKEVRKVASDIQSCIASDQVR